MVFFCCLFCFSGNRSSVFAVVFPQPKEGHYLHMVSISCKNWSRILSAGLIPSWCHFFFLLWTSYRQSLSLEVRAWLWMHSVDKHSVRHFCSGSFTHIQKLLVCKRAWLYFIWTSNHKWGKIICLAHVLHSDIAGYFWKTKQNIAGYHSFLNKFVL